MYAKSWTQSPKCARTTIVQLTFSKRIQSGQSETNFPRVLKQKITRNLKKHGDLELSLTPYPKASWNHMKEIEIWPIKFFLNHICNELKFRNFFLKKIDQSWDFWIDVNSIFRKYINNYRCYDVKKYHICHVCGTWNQKFGLRSVSYFGDFNHMHVCIN